MKRKRHELESQFELLLLVAGPPFDRWMSKEVFFHDEGSDAWAFRRAVTEVFGDPFTMQTGRSKIVSDYTKWFKEMSVSRPHLKKVGLDTKFEALSLLFGPPDPQWQEFVAPWYFTACPGAPRAIRFRDAVQKCFSQGEIDRVRIHRIAHDYAEWYQLQEQSNAENSGSSVSGGSDPRGE